MNRPHPTAINPEATRFEQGKSMTQLQRERHVAHSAIRFSEAYAELGGGVQDRIMDGELGARYGEFIDNYEPWKQDIAIGFETFNLPALTLEGIRDMSERDQRTLAQYFDQFVGSIASRGRVLATSGSWLNERFDGYGFTSDEQAVDYGQELKRFETAIKATDTYGFLHFLSLRIEPDSVKRDAKLRHDRAKGIPTVIHDVKTDKLRIMRLDMLSQIA